MELLFLVLIVLFAVVLVRKFRGPALEGEKKVHRYHYKKKPYFMTSPEHKFYDLLINTVGSEYHIFAQVHLPTVVDHKVKGQSWRGAFSYINRKSVDFVLCDKKYIAPCLAIELDDSSHCSPKRQGRDREVERILEEVKLPLLRFESGKNIEPQDLLKKRKEKLA